VLFAIAFNVVEMVLWALLLVQFLARLFSGKPIERASVFGQNLASYAYEIVRFLTFRSDETPWPFAPWPDGPPNWEPSPAAATERPQAGAPGQRQRRGTAGESTASTGTP